MPILLFLKKWQNLKLLSATNCRWHFMSQTEYKDHLQTTKFAANRQRVSG